ncbi:MAG: class I SAM-dependent methyltransferase [Candidatus Omnitrophica bacterium]|nr:class I SAM-dependent methyltransferase [Candidatus Omnitrophota bacterium]
MEARKAPWCSGYHQLRARFIKKVIHNTDLLAAFAKNSRLPKKYGVGLDERCIEIPWLLSRLSSVSGHILDAGSGLSHNFIVEHPTVKGKEMHIIAFSPEGSFLRQKEVSFICADLRAIPIEDDYYDVIACISVLEHIGFDNTYFTHNEDSKEHHPDDFTLVVKELRRVLKPGGRLVITVPFGLYRDFGFFQQFDGKMLSRIAEAFGKTEQVSETFYRYTADGWQVSTADDCAECEYVGWVAEAWRHRQRPRPIFAEPDLAAAARAVACMQLIKR